MLKLMYTCFFLLFISQAAMSDSGHTKSKGKKTVIHGIAVTGINDLLGSPVGPGPSAQLLGEYIPGGDEPLPLTPATSADAIMATHISQGFLDLVGLPRDFFPPDIDNVPLHLNPVPVAPSIHIRAPAAPASVAGANVPSRRDENPITLGEWLDARGKVTIKCSMDGMHASVRFFFRGLVDNGLYTVWTVSVEGFPTAFGGVPNSFTADHRGSASFRREVAYCPTDGQLLDFTAAYHSDGMMYGNFPDATLDGFPSGVVTHDHVVFPLL